MNIEETERTIRHEVSVRANIMDAPKHSGHWGNQEFRPDFFYAHYSFDEGRWECTSASISGPNIKKDGSLGLKVVRDNYYRPDHSAPGWMVDIVESLRPKSGAEG